MGEERAMRYRMGLGGPDLPPPPGRGRSCARRGRGGARWRKRKRKARADTGFPVARSRWARQDGAPRGTGAPSRAAVRAAGMDSEEVRKSRATGSGGQGAASAAETPPVFRSTSSGCRRTARRAPSSSGRRSSGARCVRLCSRGVGRPHPRWPGSPRRPWPGARVSSLGLRVRGSREE